MKKYEKDETTGVVSLNCGDTASFTVAGTPGVAARNARARVLLPADKKPYTVKVEYEGKDFVMVTGVTNTPTDGKALSLSVKIRAEGEFDIPADPALGEIG